MEFKLSFNPEAPHKLINYKQPFLLTGSCFTQHMHEKLAHHMFNTCSQPNGVVFNPISIANHLLKVLQGYQYNNNQLLLYNNLWHTWDHHSSFSHIDPNQALLQINTMLNQAHLQLKKEAPILIITLGSAWVYKHKLSGNTIVANCHKYPQADFSKELLTVQEIITAFKPFLQATPHIQIFFTISPVRHTKDTLVGNNRSKAILIQAVHELCNLHKQCDYFPAYEIIIDELRDYRFYAKDLVHPNDLAVDYVWDCFVKTCFDEETKQYVQEVKQYKQMEGHRFLHDGLPENQKFKEAIHGKKAQLSSKYQVPVSF